MGQRYTTTLIRLYPFEKGRDRILAALKSYGLFRRVVAQSPEPAVLKTGQTLHVLGSEYMSDYIRLWGEFERKTEHFILSHLRAGCQFLDIGANFGYFSIIACNELRSCRVRALEPNPVVAQALRESVKANSLHSQVEVLEMAVSDKPGFLPFICHESNLGLSHLQTAGSKDVDSTRNIATVKVVVWDEWISTNDFTERTSILKMDIEGAELKALRGMKGWLLRNKPAIVVEANNKNLERFGGTRGKMEAFFVELGYTHALPADNNFYLEFKQ